MSKQWVLRTLDRLQQYRPQPEYEHIKTLIENDQYSARLFKIVPLGERKIQIHIYKIKNKGAQSYEIFKESTLKAIELGDPANEFEVMVLEAYNSCRAKALHKFFPMLKSDAIDELMSDNYLKKEDIKKHLQGSD